MNFPAPRRIKPPKRLSEETLAAFGLGPIELCARELQDAREDFREAMKHLDHPETRDLHVRIGQFINELDDFSAVLAERSRS